MLGKTQRAALELLAVEIDRHGEPPMRGDHLAVVTVAMRLAAARAGVAADPHALAARDRVLKGLADLREQPRAQPTVDEARGILVDDPMVDAIAPAVLGNAHLVVRGHLVLAVAGLDESFAAGLIDLDQPA